MNDELKEIIKEFNQEEPNIQLKISNRPDLCDYQYDGIFAIAKKNQQNPYDLGCKIVTKLQENFKCLNKFSKIECVRPGFINFTLSDEYINELLNKMLKSSKFNITMPIKETIVIDYGGANIAKPLHVGHLRPAIVGESIKRLLIYMNQKVISDVHLGDYGLQIGQVIYGLLKENISTNEITIELLIDLYPKISSLCKENEQIKAECSSITKQLQDGHKLYQEYFRKLLEISKEDIKKLYDYLGVNFDLWLGESDSYKYIPELTKALENQDLLENSNGAKVIYIAEEKDKNEIPPLIYQTSNQAFLYSTTDLATIYQRKKDYNPNKILYVADSRQNLHFTQVFRVSKKLEKTKDIDLEFLGFGTINGPDGKPFKTRSGNTPKLEELFKETKDIYLKINDIKEDYSVKDLDIIVNSIIKYADLQNNREKGYVFDIDKFSSSIGKTGPYILYTFLRTQKIIKNNQTYIDKLSKTIYNGHDRNLRMKLLELDEIINYAFKMRMPSIIANYLYDICVLMNAFYENNHINNLKDINIKKDWITLLDLTTRIIKTLLDILVIDIPSKM